MNSTLFFNMPNAYKVGYVRFDLLLEESHSIKSTVTQHPIEAGSSISDHIINELRTGTLKGLISNFSLKRATGIEAVPELGPMLGQSFRRYAGGLTALATGALGGASSKLPGIGKNIAAGATGLAVAGAYLYGVHPTAAEVRAVLAKGLPPENTAKDGYQLFKTMASNKAAVEIVTGLEKYPDVLVTEVSVTRTSDTGECLEFEVNFTEYRRVSRKLTSLSTAITPKLDTKAGQAAQPKRKVGNVVGTNKTTPASKVATTKPVSNRLPMDAAGPYRLGVFS